MIANTTAALRPAGAQCLPCLNRNISIRPAETVEIPSEKQPVAAYKGQAAAQAKQEQLNQQTTANKKSAFSLEMNVHSFIEYFGLEHVGFLTLTFADDVQDPKEAQRRFNSLRTNFLRHHYPHYIRVIERTKAGRIHYHLLVACKEDIRRGLNFKAIAAKDYSSANHAIRAHWKRLREAMPKYGFGRCELLPVKTNSKGLARYVAKYIGKHINARIADDKGIRLCQTSQDKTFRWKKATSNFQFASQGAKEWRRKLKKWVESVDSYFRSLNEKIYRPITETDYSQRLTALLGSKWAYANRETIYNVDSYDFLTT